MNLLNIQQIGDIQGTKPRDRTFNRTDKYEAINYRDVTHDQFKSQRTTNPLEPSYIVRNEHGSTETIGKIENNSAFQIPTRKRGPLSSNLDTSDIIGAQASTK